MRRVQGWIGLVCALALLAGACTTDEGSDAGGATTVAVDEDAVEAPWDLRPGVEQVSVQGAEPGQPLTLLDAAGTPLLTLEADDDGNAHFAYLPTEHLTIPAGPGSEETVNEGDVVAAGEGYRVVDTTTDPVVATAPFGVLDRDDHPDPSFYDDRILEEGFNYIQMRDGVTLSANVTFPDPALYGDGPYPTVVEYSGYAPSNPDGGDPGAMIANLFGFATVGVNLRGSGCSGGVFDIFNPAQHADGYDVIETVARQPWVRHGEVGMIGLSYGGITQLYVASTRPPSLAAITPLSVIEDLYRIQRPGGVYNAGFTRQWLAERDRATSPEGSSWVTEIAESDEVCAQNLELRALNPDFEAFGRALEFYLPLLDGRRLSLLVPEIEVPVYLTGAWQDEQTGGWFPAMLDDFTGTDVTRFTLFNGRHPDGYTPGLLSRWYEFLSLYVAKEVPEMPPLVRAAAPEVFSAAMGVEGLELEEDRFASLAGDYDAALATYEAEPSVRILFEHGAGHEVPGAPVARFELELDSWPPPVEAETWYLGEDGTLLDSPPSDPGGADAYRHDPEAGMTSYTDQDAGSFILPQIAYDWTRFAEGTQLSYLSEPFEDDTVVLGPGYAELWFDPGSEDVNVQVTISLVEPDEVEWFVQAGWLRLGHRVVDPERSDELLVDYTFTREDFELLEPGEIMQVRVPIYPVAQVFRAGTRLRMTVETPGRNLPLWKFENPEADDEPTHRVLRAPEQASLLRLGVLEVAELDVPAEHPPCPSLRGQVCREYLPVANAAG